VANSLFMVTWIGASMLGFGIGAPLVNLAGEQATFVVAASLYLISAGAVFLIPLEQKKIRENGQTGGFIKDFLLGLELIRRNFIISYSLINMFVATSAIAVISLLSISYAKDVLDIGAKNFGYLIVTVGIGMLFGSPLLGKLSHYFKKGILTIIGFITSGSIIMAIANTRDLKTALALTFLLGICTVFVTSPLQTILQQRIPRQLMGRVFGFQNMLINSAFVFPVLVWGLIADKFGTPFAISLLGAMLLFAGLLGVITPKFKNI
jgi:DHA3 family macrolide efflux protein-like MFS transporter